VLAESGAIVEYIVQRHGKGRLCTRPESPEYPRYVYWLHFAEGSLMSLMLIALVLSRMPEAKESPVRTRIARSHEGDARVRRRRDRGARVVRGREFTAADVMMVFPFTTMRRFLDYDLSPYANITAY
jgi:glutathione S-transferase